MVVDLERLADAIRLVGLRQFWRCEFYRAATRPPSDLTAVAADDWAGDPSICGRALSGTAGAAGEWRRRTTSPASLLWIPLLPRLSVGFLQVLGYGIPTRVPLTAYPPKCSIVKESRSRGDRTSAHPSGFSWLPRPPVLRSAGGGCSYGLPAGPRPPEGTVIVMGASPAQRSPPDPRYRPLASTTTFPVDDLTPVTHPRSRPLGHVTAHAPRYHCLTIDPLVDLSLSRPDTPIITLTTTSSGTGGLGHQHTASWPNGTMNS